VSAFGQGRGLKRERVGTGGIGSLQDAIHQELHAGHANVVRGRGAEGVLGAADPMAGGHCGRLGVRTAAGGAALDGPGPCAVFGRRHGLGLGGIIGDRQHQIPGQRHRPNELHVVDLVRRVRSAMQVRMVAGVEEDRRDPALGEAVVVRLAPVAVDTLAEIQVMVAHQFPGLLHEGGDLARDGRRGDVQGPRGVSPQHVHVHVGHDLAEAHGGVLDEGRAAQQALLLAAAGQEEDAALGGCPHGQGRQLHQGRRSAGIVIGPRIVAVHAPADVVEVGRHHHVLALQRRIGSRHHAHHVGRLGGQPHGLRGRVHPAEGTGFHGSEGRIAGPWQETEQPSTGFVHMDAGQPPFRMRGGQRKGVAAKGLERRRTRLKVLPGGARELDQENPCGACGLGGPSLGLGGGRGPIHTFRGPFQDHHPLALHLPAGVIIPLPAPQTPAQVHRLPSRHRAPVGLVVQVRDQGGAVHGDALLQVAGKGVGVVVRRFSTHAGPGQGGEPQGLHPARKIGGGLHAARLARFATLQGGAGQVFQHLLHAGRILGADRSGGEEAADEGTGREGHGGSLKVDVRQARKRPQDGRVSFGRLAADEAFLRCPRPPRSGC